jgi:hypothetical protein
MIESFDSNLADAGNPLVRQPLLDLYAGFPNHSSLHIQLCPDVLDIVVVNDLVLPVNLTVRSTLRSDHLSILIFWTAPTSRE